MSHTVSNGANGKQSPGGPQGEIATIEDIAEYIQTLDDHMRQCERAGKYVEAQTALMKIEELRNESNKRQKEQLRARHLNEKLEIEEAHLSEFNQFNEYWDKRMNEFNGDAQKAEEEMMSRHQDELAKFEEELNKSLPERPKDSAELLNLRKIEENLARQKDYIEAHKVQQKCMMIEKEELDKWTVTRDQKIKNQLTQLINKQQQELNALRKRVVSAQEEQRKARSGELERLIQKYQNIKKELEVQQQLELQKLEKSQRTSGAGSVMRSTYGGGSKYATKGMNQSRMKN